MAHISMSQALADSVHKVMSDQDNNILLMKMFLISDDKSMHIEIGSPDRLDIVRNFEKSFSDYIEVEFDLSPAEYIQAMEHYKDLRCVINFFKTDVAIKKLDDPLHTMDNRIVFKEKLDLFKVLPKDKILPVTGELPQERHMSARLAVTGQLLDPIEYQFRKMRCNGIHENITLIEALKLYVHQFGITGVKVAEPNNTKSYTNFLIEPLKNISNLFGYLQERYGIYEKGVCYYVHNKIMYIYPNYEVDMSRVWNTDTVHVYNVDPSAYTSSQCFHKIIDDELHIVSNSKVIDHDGQAIYAEEVANTILVDFRDELLSNSDQLNQDKVSVDLAERIRVLEIGDIETMTSDTLSVRYGISYGNPYPIMTELNRMKSVMTSFNWNMANPFAVDIKPGSQWFYHFDGENGYEIVPATCRELVFSISVIGQQGHDKVYGTECMVSLYTDKTKNKR